MPSPIKAEDGLHKEANDGIVSRRYDVYHKGGTTSPRMSVPNPIETNVYQTDTYGNNEFYGWDVSTKAGDDQRMCPRYEAPGKGEVDEQAERRQR